MPKFPVGNLSQSLNDEKNKGYLIVKSNKIVQRTHYSMTLSQQKILASLIRSIKPNQQSLTVKFSTKQYMRMLGLHRSGTTFGGIMHTLKRIADKSFYMKLSDGKYHLMRWLDKVVADPNANEGGDFLVTFRPNLRQYLFNQSIKYRTIYKFSDVMLMRSRYSPRLYEIFRSNQSRQKVEKRGLNYKISELKCELNLMKRNRTTGKARHDKNGHFIFKYPSFSEFRRNVLRPAERDINRFTEFNIKMRRIRSHGRGRKVVGVNVSMIRKNKKQKVERDDLIYCITHNIPKSEWKYWRENTIRGTFRKIKPRKKRKTIDGNFQVLNSDKEKDLKKMYKVLHVHPVPFREIDMLGSDVKYYSPLVHRYVWTSMTVHDKQKKMYYEQRKIDREQNEMIKQLKKDQSQNRK